MRQYLLAPLSWQTAVLSDSLSHSVTVSQFHHRRRHLQCKSSEQQMSSQIKEIRALIVVHHSPSPLCNCSLLTQRPLFLGRTLLHLTASLFAGTATGEAASSHLFSPRFYLLISFHQQFPFTCPLLSTVLCLRMFKLSSRFPPPIQSARSHLLCSLLSSSPDQNLRLAATPIGTALFAKREPP